MERNKKNEKIAFSEFAKNGQDSSEKRWIVKKMDSEKKMEFSLLVSLNDRCCNFQHEGWFV